MAELFIDPAKTFASGYEAATAVGEDIASTSTLKKAYEQTTPEADSGSKDMFKVNSLAAQMAASRGQTRLADKFEKQAEASQKSAIENQLNQMKAQDAKFGQFEKTIQMINTSQDGINAALKSDLPDDMKMRVVDMFKQAGDNPEKIAALKDKFQTAAMDAKDRMTAQQKILQMELSHKDKQDALEVRREGLQLQADIAAGGQKDRKEWHEYLKTKDKEDRIAKQEKSDDDLLMNYDKLITAAEKIKDPEARKKRVKQLERRRQDAEDRQYNRGIEEGQPDSLGRHKAKTGVPSESDWLVEAKKANPEASEADLKAYYKKTYGKK